MSTAHPDDARLFRRPYVLYISGRFFGTLANTSQAVVIAWEVYEIARRSMSVAEAASARSSSRACGRGCSRPSGRPIGWTNPGRRRVVRPRKTA